MGTSSSLVTSRRTAAAGSGGWNGASAAANALSDGIVKRAFCSAARSTTDTRPSGIPDAVSTRPSRSPSSAATSGRGGSSPGESVTAPSACSQTWLASSRARMGRPVCGDWASWTISATASGAVGVISVLSSSARETRARLATQHRRCDIHTSIDAAHSIGFAIRRLSSFRLSARQRRGSSLAQSQTWQDRVAPWPIPHRRSRAPRTAG